MNSLVSFRPKEGMEIHKDSNLLKENGNSVRALASTKEHPEVPGPAMHCSRTPLADVKNKHSQRTPGLLLSSRKFSIDSCTRPDILSQNVTDTPKRQDRKVKSRKSCFAVFNIPQDLNASENRVGGITLPRAIEEEPENLTLQSQMLCRDISELTKSSTSGMKSTISKTDQSSREASTLSTSQFHISLGGPSDLDLGNDLALTDDGAVADNKHSFAELEADLAVGHQQAQNSEDFKYSATSCSPKKKSCYESLVVPETDKLVNMLVEDCSLDFSKNFDTNILLDHPYSSAASKNVNSASQFEAAVNTCSSPEVFSTIHSTETFSGERHFHEQQFSTPKAAKVVSSCQSFLIPQLSSPFELISISSSSVKEELQTTKLADLIHSYLPGTNCSTTEFSFSPLVMDLPEYYDMNQNNQGAHFLTENLSESMAYTPQSLLAPACINHNDGKFEVHLSNGKKISYLESEKSKSVMSTETVYTDTASNVQTEISTETAVSAQTVWSANTSSTNLQTEISTEMSVIAQTVWRPDTSLNVQTGISTETAVGAQTVWNPNTVSNVQTEITTETAVGAQTVWNPNTVSDVQTEISAETVVSASDVQTEMSTERVSACTSSSVQTEVSTDSTLRAQTKLKPDTASNAQTEISSETAVSAHAVFSPDTSLNAQTEISAEPSVYAQTVFSEYTPSSVQTEISAEVAARADTETSVYVGEDVVEVYEQMPPEKHAKYLFRDHFKTVSNLSANKSNHENDVTLSSHYYETEVVCAATNTSTIEQADVSVLTDHPQHSLVNTSMVTDLCHGTDVFMLTNDVSMATDCVDMFDHSVMAVPEFQTQETMTEKQTMVDAESVMTPLRLGKQGKRLTAEEIRRQHPRIVANQLEVLMSSNQRLQKEVDVITHDRDRLKSVLTETRSRLTTADKQLSDEKERQGGIISVIEQYHRKAVEGLETSVKEKLDYINRLEVELRDIKAKYEETQERDKSSILELQEKCAALEKLNLGAEQHYSEHITNLKSQFEENSYHRAFLASQQVIKELQAEKEEFAGLIDDIENWTSVQSHLQECHVLLMTKSQKAVQDHGSMYEQLVKENQTLYQQYTSIQTDLEVALSENKDLHQDIQNINDILKRSNDNYTALDNMYQAVKQDLCRSQVEVAGLNSKIEFGFNIVKDLMKVKADLTDKLTEYEQLSDNLQSAEERIQNLELQLEEEKQLAVATKDKYEKMVAEYEASKTKLELSIENLRNTLDSWEVDRDAQEQEINDYQEQIERQRSKMEEMSKELQTLRKITATTQTERDYFKELKNTNHFLEAEKQLYFEAITDYRTRLEAEMELAASNNNLIEALRSNNAELQQSNDQLMSDVQILEDTLSMKAVDMDMSWAAMENLQERMESVLASLQQKFGIGIKHDLSAKDKFVTPKKPYSSFQEGSSFVAQCLSAAKGHPPQGTSELHISSTSSDYDSSIDGVGKTKFKQSNVQYGALQPKLGAEADALLSPYSQNSVMLTDSSKKLMSLSDTSRITEKAPDMSQKCIGRQTSVRKDISKLYPEKEQNTLTPGYAKICSIPSTMDRTLESMAKVRGDNSRSAGVMNSSLDDVSQCSDVETVLAKVKGVDRLFSLILRTVDMAERASQLAIKDLKEDIVLLKDKLKFQRNKASGFENELSKKSADLVAANLQIKDLNARVSGMTRSLLNVQDQQFDITRLEEEKADLKSKVHGLRGEVTLLTEQLEEVIQKLDDVKSGQKSEGACVREIVSLKRKNHELIMKLFDERDKNKEVGERAIRRIKILESNWKKAEAEVCRFDELVDKIRETCIESQAQLTHPAILHVVRLIDGIANQSRSETSDKTPRKLLT